MKKGKIIDIDNLEVVGEHEGVYYYTIGQRKGFGVGGNRGPYYCVGKDVKKNILYLTSVENEDYLNSDSCLVEDINWIEEIPEEMELECKFRYRQQDNKVHLKKINENSVMLTYPQKIKAVTPGQQAVLYKDGMLIGGGVIEDTFYNGVSVAKWLNDRVNNG